MRKGYKIDIPACAAKINIPSNPLPTIITVLNIILNSNSNNTAMSLRYNILNMYSLSFASYFINWKIYVCRIMRSVITINRVMRPITLALCITLLNSFFLLAPYASDPLISITVENPYKTGYNKIFNSVFIEPTEFIIF